MNYGNKHKYEGLWENDVKSGQGIYFYPDGSYYEGTFKDGMRNG